MLNESVKKLKEKENWCTVDMGMAVGIVMGRALKNSGQKNMTSMNATGILKSKTYNELSKNFCENFTGYYSNYLDRDEDADVNVLCSRIILFLEDKIKLGEKMKGEVENAIIAGYNMQ